MLAWGVDYSAPRSVGDSVQATFNEDTYDFPATNAEGFIGFVSDTPISSILLQNPDSNLATLVLDDFSFITGPRIISPADGSIATSGTAVLFSAIPAEVTDPTWTSSIDDLIGSGTSLSSDLLSTGIHRITITDGSSESTFLLAVLDAAQGPQGETGAQGPQGPAGVVDTEVLEALQNSITELTQQAECQRVFSVLKFADALQLVLDKDSKDDDYIELDQCRVERLGIQVADAVSCVKSITNLSVQLKEEEPDQTDMAVDLEITLVDTDDKIVITTLEEGTTISASNIADRKITIAACIPKDSPFFGKVGSMYVNLNNGQIEKTENCEPYSLFGDTRNGSVGEEGILNEGANTITFSLFSDENLKGTSLGTVTRNFTVIT